METQKNIIIFIRVLNNRTDKVRDYDSFKYKTNNNEPELGLSYDYNSEYKFIKIYKIDNDHGLYRIIAVLFDHSIVNVVRESEELNNFQSQVTKITNLNKNQKDNLKNKQQSIIDNVRTMLPFDDEMRRFVKSKSQLYNKSFSVKDINGEFRKVIDVTSVVKLLREIFDFNVKINNLK